MKISPIIHIDGRSNSKVSLDRKNKLIIQFKPGGSREHAKKFILGNEWKSADGKVFDIPGRDIFKQYLESGGYTKITDILRKSMLKRFKGVKVAQQLEEAGQDIVKDIADFVYADKLKPENGPVYKKQKLDAPVGVYTGEMIDGLEAVYVRKP